jgi:hypothetical protein
MAIMVCSLNLDGNRVSTDDPHIVLCEPVPIPCDGGLPTCKQAEQRASYMQDQAQQAELKIEASTVCKTGFTAYRLELSHVICPFYIAQALRLTSL